MKALSILLICMFMIECDTRKQPEPVQKNTKDRILYIARHAKSSWKDTDLFDYERPLNKRGKKDAPKIGKILYSKGVLPDLIISSPAKRARKTARLLAKKINYPKENIVEEKAIYEASISDLLNIIEQFNDSLQKVMIVGHNPSFTALANYLSPKYFDNIPTIGVVAISFPCSSWKEIERNSGKVIFYEYPKKYKD